MGVHRLNHAVLYVRDLTASVGFYCNVMGFQPVDMAPTGMAAAFLRAPASSNDHDLGLFETSGAAPSTAGRGTVGLYHLAWEVDTLGDLEDLSGKLQQAGALVGATDHGTTKSLYGKDPDGIEFEVVWLIPQALLTDADRSGRSRIGPLDFAAVLQRFDRDERSGIGVSR